jgi:hypothetical protein
MPLTTSSTITMKTERMTNPTCPYSHYEPCPIDSPDDLREIINHIHSAFCPLGSICDIPEHAHECLHSAAEILHCTDGDTQKAKDIIWAFTRAYEVCGGEGAVLWPMLGTLGQF